VRFDGFSQFHLRFEVAPLQKHLVKASIAVDALKSLRGTCETGPKTSLKRGGRADLTNFPGYLDRRRKEDREAA